jgi:hypothetical protein
VSDNTVDGAVPVADNSPDDKRLPPRALFGDGAIFL